MVLNKIQIATVQSFTDWNPNWYSRWHENDSETLKEWLTALRMVSCQLSLPNFPYTEEAARRIRKEKYLLFKSQKFGKNKKATVAALLHLVLRQYNKNRSIQEICRQLSLDSRLVTKQTWALKKTAIDNQGQLVVIPRKTSVDYLFEYGSRVTNDTELLLAAEEILTKLQRTGGNPVAVASGTLYHVCKNRNAKVTKEKIAQAFGISRRTVYTNEAQIRKLLKCTRIQETSLPQKTPLLAIQKRTK